MVIDVKQFELDRAVTTMRSFGWNVVRSGFENDKVKVDFEMTVTGLSPDLRKLKVDQVAGMLRNAGWSVVSSEFTDDKALIKFEKLVKGEV